MTRVRWVAQTLFRLALFHLAVFHPERKHPSDLVECIARRSYVPGHLHGAGAADERHVNMMGCTYDGMMRRAGSNRAPHALFRVSFAEISFFPIPPDVMLIHGGQCHSVGAETLHRCGMAPLVWPAET